MAANNVRGVGDTGSFSDWYREVPPITKFFFTGTFITAMCTSFNLIPSSLGGPAGLVFNWSSILRDFHIWKLITPFIFAGGFSLNFVFHMFILYENCKRYEADPYNTGAGGSSADMFYMIFFGMVSCIILGIYESTLGLGMVVMSEPILFMIIYVWSRKNPENISNMWGVKFKSLYLPWVYCGIRVVMGGSPTLILVGIAIGHLYYFLVEILPNQNGMELIKTPIWCKDLMKWVTGLTQGNPNLYIPPSHGREAAAAGGGATGGNAGLRQRAPQGANGRTGYDWGRGNVLGQ
jgi:Derlin-2/3